MVTLQFCSLAAHICVPGSMLLESMHQHSKKVASPLPYLVLTVFSVAASAPAVAVVSAVVAVPVLFSFFVAAPVAFFVSWSLSFVLP